MPQHKVYRLKARTSYNELELVEEETPTFDKHEVLIKVKSVSLNYRDLGVTNGFYPFPVKENVVPCSDACGEVVAIGSSFLDKGIAIGDLVIGNFDPVNLYGPQKDWNNGLGGPVDGVLREYVALPGASIVKIPSGTGASTAECASLVCTGTTAWNVLYGNIPLRPGQTVLFQGKSSPSLFITGSNHFF
jgi:NADPH:quinone reductase-like Zn-dependent oxidoreductase